jgi:casein kinase 1
MKQSNYTLLSEIGKGSFGKIYECLDKITNKRYALKIESKNVKNVEGQLQQEYEIYKDFQDVENWPKIHDYGHKNGYKVLVMDLFGENLENVYKKHNNKFSSNTILYIAQKMISCLKTFHGKGYIHRDMKPQNFVIDQKSNDIYLIDYGLAKKKSSHCSYNKSLTGTVRYASINTHLGIEQSFRDDMYSVGYILLYFALGKLPWQAVSQLHIIDKKEGYNKVLIEKMSIKMEKIVENLDTPLQQPILTFMFYILSLNFKDVPDYDYCISLFQSQNSSNINLH